MADFTLPELGENITEGDVLRVLVKPGDSVAKDQPVLELETDKATIEVPSSVDGQVSEVRVKSGDKVKVGQTILTVTDAAGSNAPAATPAPVSSAADSAASAQRSSVPAEPSRAEAETARASTSRRDLAADMAAGELDTDGSEPIEIAANGQRGRKVVDITRGARTPAEAPASTDLPPAPAAPSVRRMARELGVNIDQVPGSGPSGRISVDDVKAFVKRIVTSGAQGGVSPEPLPDFSRWGEIDRQPMRGVRRKTAEHLTAAWTIPHVTQHDLADITSLEALRKSYAKNVESAGGNLTVTAIALKVVAAALKAFPQFNASIDVAAEEIVFKKYVNIGVAVDTDRGLLVPVIRDVDRKNITELSVELAHLSEKARSRKITLEEMQGGCFSISNLGGIGGTAFTPIINAPEVAILGISRARTEPVWRDGSFEPRLMLPLSLSYDHRVVDGADGIRFLRWVVEAFEQPFVLALKG